MDDGVRGRRGAGSGLGGRGGLGRLDSTVSTSASTAASRPCRRPRSPAPRRRPRWPAGRCGTRSAPEMVMPISGTAYRSVPSSASTRSRSIWRAARRRRRPARRPRRPARAGRRRPGPGCRVGWTSRLDQVLADEDGDPARAAAGQVRDSAPANGLDVLGGRRGRSARGPRPAGPERRRSAAAASRLAIAGSRAASRVSGLVGGQVGPLGLPQGCGDDQGASRGPWAPAVASGEGGVVDGDDPAARRGGLRQRSTSPGCSAVSVAGSSTVLRKRTETSTGTVWNCPGAARRPARSARSRLETGAGGGCGGGTAAGR